MNKKITFELDFVFDIFQIQIGGVCWQLAYVLGAAKESTIRTMRGTRRSKL